MRFVALAATSLVYTLVEVSVRLLQFVILIWMAKVSTKQEYGEFGVWFAVQQAVAMLAIGGLSQSILGQLNDYRSAGNLDGFLWNARSLFRKCSIVILVGGVCFLGSSWLLSHSVETIVIGLGALVSGLLMARFQIETSFLQAREFHGKAFITKCVPVAVYYLSGFVGMLVSNFHLLGFFLGGSLSLAVLSVAMMFKNQEYASEESLRGLQQSLLRESVPFAILAIFGWLSDYGNTILIRLLIGNLEVAEYTLACTLAFAVLVVINSIAQVWSPVFFRRAYEGREYHLENAFVHRVQLFLTGVTAGGLLIGYREILSIFKGNLLSYERVLPYLGVLLASFAILTIYYRSTNYFVLHREGKTFFRVMMIGNLIGLLVSAGLMIAFKMWGIYTGFLISATIRGALVYLVARTRWNVRLTLGEIPVTLALIAGALVISMRIAPLGLRLALFGASAIAAGCLVFIGDRMLLRRYILEDRP